MAYALGLGMNANTNQEDTNMDKVHIQKVTTTLGVAKWSSSLWIVVDLETHAQIGSAQDTKNAALAYAFHRQMTTYG
jgi:hypothetical protein